MSNLGTVTKEQLEALVSSDTVMSEGRAERVYQRPIVSIDLETTGLDHECSLVLEFGAVIEDYGNLVPVAELPTYRKILKYDQIWGNPFALQMNIGLLRVIAKEPNHPDLIQPGNLGSDFAAWLESHGFKRERGRVKVTAMGKNFGSFDKPFLANVPGFLDHIQFNHRFLDPGTAWFNPVTDAVPPSLGLCLERAGLPAEVPHTAVEDAILVIKALRCRYSLPI